MPDDVNLSAPSPVKRGRGRPSSVPPESPQERIKRLQTELQHAHEAQKKAEQHKAEIAWSVVIKHARADADFRRQLVGLLHKAVTLRADVKSKADLAALSEVAHDLELLSPAAHKP